MPLPAPLQHLLGPAAYPHPVGPVRLIETHISWVLIAGDHAYKIKKPVDLGFLDFSTIDKRRFCCEEEIRLNRRLAPDIYLGVVAVTDTGIGTTGELRDWAVQMRAFPADATLDREAAATPEQIDAIADRVARFHGEIATAPEDGEYGTPEAVMYPVRENVRQIQEFVAPPSPQPLASSPSPHPLPPQGGGTFPPSPLEGPARSAQDATQLRSRGERGMGRRPTEGPGVGGAATHAPLARLETWAEQEYLRLHDHFAARKAGGHIRECHGDLHLGNIAWVDGAPLIFDCIEFNPALRYVDVVSEAAFLGMDLIARGQEAMAWRFLNRYLEHTGDYAGLAALRFYLVYRAMVRAKVACIRASQGASGAAAEAARYLDLAGRLAVADRPALVLMHGCSGSGKTWLSQRILETLGAIRLRSDVERKRLYGVPALADSRQAAGDIYTPEAGRRTFDHLRNLAGGLLGQGYRVIVDATFISQALRADFAGLAEGLAVPWYIASVEADAALLRERVSHRHGRGDDASEADLAVLESQLRNQEPLDDDEARHRVAFPAGGDISAALLALHRMVSND